MVNIFLDNLIAKENVNQFFILDSKGKSDPESKYNDLDYHYYCYNTKRYNRLKAGAIFLYRRPGKITKNKRFKIIGGGIIDSIVKQDDEGNVKAFIKDGFQFTKPLEQGDPDLENMVWTSKKRKNERKNWSNFWNQYGMNEINKTDFINLTKNLNSFQIGSKMVDDKRKIEITGDKFTVIPADKKNKSLKKHSNNYIGHKVDFTKINQRKMHIGEIGEQIVLNLLQEEAKKNKLKSPLHASKVEGDGLGYDIKKYNKDGSEEFIEVKTTTSSNSAGFEMSQNEINFSEKARTNYKVYRLFNLNNIDMTVNIAIFEGPFNTNNYQLEPVSVRIFLK